MVRKYKNPYFCHFPIQQKNRTTYLIKKINKILRGTERSDYLNEDPTGGGQKRVSFSHIPQNKNEKKEGSVYSAGTNLVNALYYPAALSIRQGRGEERKKSVDTGGGRRW